MQTVKSTPRVGLTLVVMLLVTAAAQAQQDKSVNYTQVEYPAGYVCSSIQFGNYAPLDPPLTITTEGNPLVVSFAVSMEQTGTFGNPEGFEVYLRHEVGSESSLRWALPASNGLGAAGTVGETVIVELPKGTHEVEVVVGCKGRWTLLTGKLNAVEMASKVK